MPGLFRSRLLSGACLVALALAWSVPGHGQDVLEKGANPFEEPEFLPVDEAFVLTARVTEDGVLEADWRMPDGYYLYRHQFGFETRDGTTLGTPEVPAGLPKTDEFFGDVEVFYGAATVRVPVLEAGGDPFEVGIAYQGCADYGLCYPPERKWLRFAAAGLDPGGGGSGVPFSELVVILASALLGGLILNLMPCVFPVLSIKALSLLGEPEGRMRDATGFSAGVVATFVALGLVLVGLKSAGEAVGWGFQLQSPGFVTAMALLFFVLGLNLLGVLETPGFGVGGFERAGPFATGMLAVVVATPCTVPFMGAAVGYGLAQPAPVLLAVMAALGVGMALPYAVVAGVPAIARRLPRPGAWMATLKQVMAFPMFATVVWLVWVLAQQAGPGGAAWVLAAFVAVGFLAWLGIRRPARLRPVWLAVGALAVAVGVGGAGRGPVDRRAGAGLRHGRGGGAPGRRPARVPELHRVLVHHLPDERTVDPGYRSRPGILRPERHRLREGRLDQRGPGDHGGAGPLRAQRGAALRLLPGGGRPGRPAADPDARDRDRRYRDCRLTMLLPLNCMQKCDKGAFLSLTCEIRGILRRVVRTLPGGSQARARWHASWS